MVRVCELWLQIESISKLWLLVTKMKAKVTMMNINKLHRSLQSSSTIKMALHQKQELVNNYSYFMQLPFLFSTILLVRVLVCGAQSPSGLLLLFQV